MKEQIIAILEDILEEDNIDINLILDEDNWDSLNVVSFIAEINTNFQIVLDPVEVNGVEKVAELLDLVMRMK